MLTQVTLEMNGVCQSEVILYKHCALVDKVISHEGML